MGEERELEDGDSNLTFNALLFDGITNRIMCIRSCGIGSPLSMTVRIRFMVSTLFASVPFSSCVLSSWSVGVSLVLS